MIVLFYLVGIVLLGIGLVAIAAPGLMWRWQRRQNDFRGVESRYTEAWERSRVVRGLFFVALGVIWFVIVITRVQPYL